MAQFNLYDSIGFILVNTSFQAKQNLTALFQKNNFDTTVDQFAVLAALNSQEGITQKQLSKITCKNDSNLTRILSGMEKKGYVVRKKGHDARSRLVFLSSRGKALLVSLIPIAESYNHQIFQGFTEEETLFLKKILLHIQERITIDYL